MSNFHELLSSKRNKKRETFKLVHEISELKLTKFGSSHENFYLWPWPKILCKIPTFRYTTIKVTNLSKLPEKVY